MKHAVLPKHKGKTGKISAQQLTQVSDDLS